MPDDEHGGTAQIEASPREERSLAREMQVGAAELAWRKAFLELDDDDVVRLQSVSELARRYADSMIKDFYTHLLSFEEGRAFFDDPRVLEYVQQRQKEYFLGLTEGHYDLQYVEDRLRIGEVHQRIGLPVKTYLGMYNFYLRSVASRLMEAFPDDLPRAMTVFLSLMKVVFLDIGLATDTYIYQRERTIGEQQQAIRELSTPVLQVRDGLVILPMIGLVDPMRARQLTDSVLHAIRANRARVVILDITGVPGVDSAVANHLLQTVDASRLMGAQTVVTGISPDVAQALVRLGVDLSRLSTVGDLQGGIEEAERLLGYEVTRHGGAAPPVT